MALRRPTPGLYLHTQGRNTARAWSLDSQSVWLADIIALTLVFMAERIKRPIIIHCDYPKQSNGMQILT